ncbi:response regulator [Pseudoduganella sp. LjRoot289]|uniref:response regulator n=1 Tax=Pseudoduganella sp. LjRoot289 TaxID=3342314 RepID=UPI003ECC4AA5
MIDDDVFMLDMLGIMLEDMGIARVTATADGRQGLSAFDPGKLPPDLVICDINMPQMDGFQLMEQLGASHPGCAIILMSGLAQRFLDSAQLMARFHHLNILGALHKPVDKHELAGLMSRLALPAPPKK